MTKYLLKSKILATLNETLNKIKLSEAGATVTPPEMDANGNFVSSVETSKKPSGIGINVEKDNKANNNELLKQAREKIKNSEDLINDIEGIIGKISGKTAESEWKVNEDNNDVYLQSKDAHIFQQNDSICLSHSGKVEIFKTADELHDWLKKNGWPLPPAIKIHESTEKNVLQEIAKGTVAKAWNVLVDLANGLRKLVRDQNTGKRFLVSVQNPKDKFEVTQVVEKELAKAVQDPNYLKHFKGKAKFSTTKGSELNNDNDLNTKVTSGDQRFDDVTTMQQWVKYYIKNGTETSLSKRDDFTRQGNSSLASIINAASNGKPGSRVFGDKTYAFTQEDFAHDLDELLNAVQKNSTKAKLLGNLLNNQEIPLNPNFVDFVQKRYNYYKTKEDDLDDDKYKVTDSSKVELDNKIQELFESSKKFPWLNEMISQHLIKEDDAVSSNPTSAFNNAVASAGGMDMSSGNNAANSDVNNINTDNGDIDNEIMNDLNTNSPDLSGSSSGSNDFDFNFGGGLGGDGSEVSQPVAPQEMYDIIDIKFPNKEEGEEYNNSEIIVTLKNKEDGQIVYKPLKDIDTL